MNALIRILIISLLMSTSVANVAFADMAGMSQPAVENAHQSMPSTDMSEHCQDGTTHHNMDSYCMDHCAHLLALGLQNHIFATEIPGSVILDLVLVVPTPDSSLLWRPPTLNS